MGKRWLKFVKLLWCPFSWPALTLLPLPLQEMVEAAGEDERELAAEMAAAFLNENLPEAIFGAPKAGAGQWASLVRLVNPIQGSTLDQVQLEQNEAAFRWASSISWLCTCGKVENCIQMGNGWKDRASKKERVSIRPKTGLSAIVCMRIG